MPVRTADPEPEDEKMLGLEAQKGHVESCDLAGRRHRWTEGVRVMGGG